MKNKRKRSTFICTSSREQLSELSAGALMSAKQRISITVHNSKKQRMKQTRKKLCTFFSFLKCSFAMILIASDVLLWRVTCAHYAPMFTLPNERDPVNNL